MTMTPLDRLESRSIYILREAFSQIDRLAMLWSLGKDSGVMVWLAKKAFFGHVPFPAVHIDTGKNLSEMYSFRDKYEKEWGLDLIVGDCPPLGEIDDTLPPAARSAAGLKSVVADRGFGGLIVGIRCNEEGTRARERVFSPRDGTGAPDASDQEPEFWDQFNTDFPAGAHVHIHPLLDWTEIDVWRYIERERIPVLDLYFARDGKRYRSLGNGDITSPIDSNASTAGEIIAELESARTVPPVSISPASDSDSDNIEDGGAAILPALKGPVPPGPPADLPLRFPIQDAFKFDERRILAGRVESGTLRVGDTLLFSPSNMTAKVAAIEAWNTVPKEDAGAGESVGITLAEAIFVERGEIASHTEDPPVETDVFRARLVWLDAEPMTAGASYTLKLATATARIVVQEIVSVGDTGGLSGRESGDVGRGEIANVILRSERMLALDAAEALNTTGRFALTDRFKIVGVGLVNMDGYGDQRHLVTKRATNVTSVEHGIGARRRHERSGHAGGVLWFTGLSASGKSTLAVEVERRLFDLGYQIYVLDGDNVRQGLNANLGFGPEDRSENIRRVGEVAALFADAGMIVIGAFISPYRSDRARARAAAGEGFHEIYVKAGLEVCEARDPRGLYKRARAGEIAEFTGISAPYEAPETPELVVDTAIADVEVCVAQITDYVTGAFALGRAQ
jgi:bifunctional enzyme CysN/CysC